MLNLGVGPAGYLGLSGGAVRLSSPSIFPLPFNLACEFGTSRSTFKNAHGLTEKGHLSTASDMAFLMKAIADDFPSYLFILGRINHAAAGKKITHSAERLLKEYRGAVAAKTGYTRAAGFNGVLLAKRENERIITVFFGGKSTTTMIAQISKLTDLGFRKTPSN